jgi:hypothetical protein
MKIKVKMKVKMKMKQKKQKRAENIFRLFTDFETVKIVNRDIVLKSESFTNSKKVS